MARQILDLFPQPSECLDHRMMNLEADLAKIPVERLLGIHPLEMVHDLCEPIDLRRFERQHLSDFPGRTAAAVGDDVGRHRNTWPDWRRAGLTGVSDAAAILGIQMLNRALAAIAAREIEIDVRPFAALFGQEALEQQIHADGIDGGDPEAVAHGAIGRRTAPLNQNVFLTAVIDDVPDNEEVAPEI